MAEFPDLTVTVRTQAEAERERLELETWRLLRPMLVDGYNGMADQLRAGAKACAEAAQLIADLEPKIPNPAKPSGSTSRLRTGERVHVIEGEFNRYSGTVARRITSGPDVGDYAVKLDRKPPTVEGAYGEEIPRLRQITFRFKRGQLIRDGRTPSALRSYAIGDRVRVTAEGTYRGYSGTVRAYGRASRCYSVRLHGLSVTKTFSSAELEHEVMFP